MGLGLDSDGRSQLFRWRGGVSVRLHGHLPRHGAADDKSFWIGFIEAAFSPGVFFLLSKWYTRKELALRVSP